MFTQSEHHERVAARLTRSADRRRNARDSAGAQVLLLAADSVRAAGSLSVALALESAFLALATRSAPVLAAGEYDDERGAEEEGDGALDQSEDGLSEGEEHDGLENESSSADEFAPGSATGPSARGFEDGAAGDGGSDDGRDDDNEGFGTGIFADAAMGEPSLAAGANSGAMSDENDAIPVLDYSEPDTSASSRRVRGWRTVGKGIIVAGRADGGPMPPVRRPRLTDASSLDDRNEAAPAATFGDDPTAAQPPFAESSAEPVVSTDEELAGPEDAGPDPDTRETADAKTTTFADALEAPGGDAPEQPGFSDLQTSRYRTSELLEFSTLANTAYDETPNPPEGFDLVHDENGQPLVIHSESGYHGFAVKARDGNIVIVSRGTDDAQDALADGAIGGLSFFRENWDAQVHDADLLTQRAMSALPGATIRFTGHSLGGAISNYLAASYEADSVSFSAPGVGDFIREAKGAEWVPKSGQFENHFREGDPIPNVGDQTGGQFRKLETDHDDSFVAQILGFDDHRMSTQVLDYRAEYGKWGDASVDEIMDEIEGRNEPPNATNLDSVYPWLKK